MGFAKAHRKVLPKKRVRGLVLGELPNIWEFPFNIYAMAESIDFKFGTQFGWPSRPIVTSYKQVDFGHGMVRSLQNYASHLIFLQWLKLQWMFLINGII